MEKDLVKILRGLKSIEPDSDFTRKSRLLIVSSPRLETTIEKNGFVLAFKNMISNSSIQRLAISFGLILIVVIGTYYWRQLFSQNNLAKADELNSSIQLKLSDIQYLIDKQAITPSKAKEFNSMLQDTAKNLKDAATNLAGKNVDDFLRQIKSAEDILQKIKLDVSILEK